MQYPIVLWSDSDVRFIRRLKHSIDNICWSILCNLCHHTKAKTVFTDMCCKPHSNRIKYDYDTVVFLCSCRNCLKKLTCTSSISSKYRRDQTGDAYNWELTKIASSYYFRASYKKHIQILTQSRHYNTSCEFS